MGDEQALERGPAKTILLVEDDESHAEMIRRYFEEDGSEWSFSHVSSVNGAMNWLAENRESPPLLVIADYRLADGTGLDLAKEAKSPEEVGFPLIILTGVGSEKLAVLTLKSGAMEYIVKDAEDMRSLPRTAKRVLREWDIILERKRTEENLRKYINNLEQANCNLEDFMEDISREMASSLSQIQDPIAALVEKYTDKMDDDDLERLYTSKGAAEKMSVLIDSLLEYLVPVYLDTSFVRLYNTKLLYLKHKSQYESNEKGW